MISLTHWHICEWKPIILLILCCTLIRFCHKNVIGISGWFFNRNFHSMNARQNLGRLRPDMTSITYNRRPHWFLNQNSILVIILKNSNYLLFWTIWLTFLKNSDSICFWKNWITMWLTFLQKQMVGEFFKNFNHNVRITMFESHCEQNSDRKSRWNSLMRHVHAHFM